MIEKKIVDDDELEFIRYDYGEDDYDDEDDNDEYGWDDKWFEDPDMESR